MKQKAHSAIHNIRIASPCTVDWDSMTGDERIRFCGQCQKNVFNLAEMTVDQIDELIGKSEGRVCVRLYRRFDGTILTKDCPVGVARLRAKLIKTWGAACAFVSVLSAGVLNYRAESGSLTLWDRLTSKPEPRHMMGEMAVSPVQPALHEPIMGQMVFAPDAKCKLGRPHKSPPPIAIKGLKPGGKRVTEIKRR